MALAGAETYFMRTLAAILVALIMTSLTLAGPAAASIDQCSWIAPGIPTPLSPTTAITGALAWKDGSCGQTGIVGGGASCPVGVGTQTGAWCGPAYVPNSLMTCLWQVLLGSTAVDLAVGFDIDGDGNVWASTDPDAVRPAPPLPPLFISHSFSFVTPATPGRLIVYPVSPFVGGSTTGTTLVSCA